MEFTDLIQFRSSIRGYQNTPVEEEKLHYILEAARLAPTAANRQPFHIIVAHTKGREEALTRVYHREWFAQAPLVICVCALPRQAWVRGIDQKNYADVDAAIVMDHLILAAANQGLGTCWIAHFNPEEAQQVFRIPAEAVPVALTPLGYAAADPRPKERKPISDLVTFIK
jgi:nitroreductase